MKSINQYKALEVIIAAIFVLLGIGLRLVPHAANFAPIATIAMFGGVYFSKKIALILPLAAMMISDVFIGFYDIKLMLSVYFSFLLCVIFGFWLKDHKKWQTILVGSFLGAVLFFIITNFAVWAFYDWYPKDFSGLTQCFAMALPFFRNTLLGDMFFAGVFFGGYEIFQKIFINVRTRDLLKNEEDRQ